MTTETMVFHAPGRLDRINVEDFETASIRSAAPSYVSEAPSYHTLPPNEVIPAYSPPSTTAINASSSRAQAGAATSSPATSSSSPSATRPSPSRQQQSTSMLPPLPTGSPFVRGAGLPPIPRRRSEAPSSVPTLAPFRAPLWSPVSGNNNPQARHYQSVANRRVAAASSPYSSFLTSSSSSSSSTNMIEDVLRTAMDRAQAANADAGIQADDEDRVRPLEDPYLVGEEAARRNRQARLGLHNEDVLVREDRRWDWWHAQMRDLDSRERSWNAFRSNAESRGQRRFRFGR